MGFDAEANQVWTGETLLGLATVWWREGNPRAAAALLSAARARFAVAGDRERLACASTLEARALLACGQVAAARRRLAASAVRAGGSARLRHLRLAAGAALAQHDGDIARARRLLARAAATAERLAARILDEQWRATFWGEWGWPHRERAALEMAEGRFEAAFEALESGRGRALVGPATSRRARGGELPASVRRWAASRHARERTRRAGETLASERSEGAAPALRRELSARPPRAMRAARLQNVLPADALLLDYLVHDGNLGALAVSRAAVHGRTALAPEATRRSARTRAAVRAAWRGVPAAGRTPLRSVRSTSTLAEFAALALWPLLQGGVPRSPRDRAGGSAHATAVGGLAAAGWPRAVRGVRDRDRPWPASRDGAPLPARTRRCAAGDRGRRRRSGRGAARDRGGACRVSQGDGAERRRCDCGAVPVARARGAVDPLRGARRLACRRTARVGPAPARSLAARGRTRGPVAVRGMGDAVGVPHGARAGASG